MNELKKLHNDIKKIRERLHFLETLLNEIPSPLFAKDGDAKFCFFNKAYEQFFNMKKSNLIGKTVLDLDYLPQKDREQYQKEDVDAISKGHVKHYEATYVLENNEKHYGLYWSKGIKVKATGQKGLVGMIVDISIQKKLEEELKQKISDLEAANEEIRKLSNTDTLTDLPNRRNFFENLEKNISLFNRKGGNLSLIMADLDFFKKVNDTFGHDIGDNVLKSFANVLKQSCRWEDNIARIGGEEFFILLPQTSIDDAFIVAERIRKLTQKKIALPDGTHQTVSLGVVKYIAKEPIKAFIKQVDEALYRAKKNGRNCVSD